ncbi:hypothetical protein RJT34_26810 [Clitoria ternatea]|uniref:BAH domain-containing protein n=1 Tax=Clitoria ternatea TaxID=43366 RepID=A0AAN9F7M6_CLITE
MSQGNGVDFKWGSKRGVGVKNKAVQFYESFVYEGVEYFVYDCVYTYIKAHYETCIAKLVKIYETPARQKMVRVVWFLRPADIRHFLGDYEPRWNELFLPSGDQPKAVSGVCQLESIIGKCNVVCTSKDKRNSEPSEMELKMAHYFFNCTYDVVRCKITDKFTDEIGGVKVEQFFNRKGSKKTSNHLNETNIGPKIVIETRNDPSTILHSQVNDKAEVRTSENVLPKRSSHSFPYKKRKIEGEKSTIGRSTETPQEEEIDEKLELRLEERAKTCKKVIDVTERPYAVSLSKSLLLPWDERLQKAQELGTLVLLNNLDPSYTSYEVEDLVFHALNEKVEARMIEWSPITNTYYGRALIIFKTKDAAESAISKLNKRCLSLGDGRIVSATKGTLSKPGNKEKFSGHLVIEQAALQKRRQEMRNAVSTSHCSQSNSIENDMAIEWLLHYERFNACRNALYQQQMTEIQDVKSKLKSDSIIVASLS